MPIGKIKIKSTRKSNYGEEVEVNNYWFDETNEPLAVIYGCFSPFTGKHGHARLLAAAEKVGIHKFIIISPNKKEKIDDDRNMFTLQQKVDIAEAGCEDLGYDVIDARIGKWTFVLGNLNDVAAEYPDNRIVLVCGPDRAEEYSKDLLAFDPERKEELPAENKRGKYELLTVNDRGERNVSGTKVRQMIRDNDEETFLEVTGYSEKIWNMCRKFANENGVQMRESFHDFIKQRGSRRLSEALGATKRVGIKHLYNPGNSQELPPLDFIDLVNLIDSEGGKLVNGENVSVTEKSDGAAFRFGIDENGFFIEQSYSGPVYSAEEFKQRCREKTGFVNRIAKGWSNLYTLLANDKKTQDGLKKIHEESGDFKLCGEIFISELGYEDEDGFVKFVGSRYDKKNLGDKATIVLFNAINASDSAIRYMIDNCSSKDIKYDDAEMKTGTSFKINVASVIEKIKKSIEAIANEYGDLEAILTNKSRKKDELALKKEVKAKIQEQQGILNSALEKQLEAYTGKWGPDYEGFVLKFSDGSMVKITSSRFKEFKSQHDDRMTNWLKQNVEEKTSLKKIITMLNEQVSRLKKKILDESCFSADDFTKKNHALASDSKCYLVMLINDILNGKNLKSGADGKGDEIKASDFNEDALEELLADVKSKGKVDKTDVERFSDAYEGVAIGRGKIFNNIFKGDYSGIGSSNFDITTQETLQAIFLIANIIDHEIRYSESVDEVIEFLDGINNDKDFIKLGMTFHLNNSYKSEKNRKSLIGMIRILKMPLDESFLKGLNKNQFAVIHPTGIISEEIPQNMVKQLFKGVNASGMGSKDVYAPADLYLVKNFSAFKNAMREYYTEGKQDPENFIKFTNEMMRENIACPISLKMSNEPKMIKYINDDNAILPSYSVHDIESVVFNLHGNSSIVVDNETDPAVKFEFRSKNIGNPWQCNILSNKKNATAYDGGSVKELMKRKDLFDMAGFNVDDLNPKNVLDFLKASNIKYTIINKNENVNKTEFYEFIKNVKKKIKDGKKKTESYEQGVIGLCEFIQAISSMADEDVDQRFTNLINSGFKRFGTQDLYKIY